MQYDLNQKIFQVVCRLNERSRNVMCWSKFEISLIASQTFNCERNSCSLNFVLQLNNKSIQYNKCSMHWTCLKSFFLHILLEKIFVRFLFFLSLSRCLRRFIYFFFSSCRAWENFSHRRKKINIKCFIIDMSHFNHTQESTRHSFLFVNLIRKMRVSNIK